MENKKTAIIIGVILCLLVGGIGFYLYKSSDNDKSEKNGSSSNTSSISTDVKVDEIEIDFTNATSSNITLNNQSVSITSGGVYTLTGMIYDGMIKVDTKEDVKLVLNNVKVTNSSGPALYIANANNVEIELTQGSINTFADGSTYSSNFSDIDGAIYSHDDLIISGEGKLVVNAKNADGIVGKDDLKITGGILEITSADDGIRGKDELYITGGTFTINAKGDGIKSTNDSDESKGFVMIDGGTFDITSTLDGIQAETKIIINDGTFSIKTGGSSTIVSTNDSWGSWGTKSSNNDSAKGIKANDNIVINGGNFNLDTSDDSVHSNNYVGIKNGTFNISSGDDGIHADQTLIIDAGTINITKSYEGLEASSVTINGGTININASDDGINVAGGNDSSSQGRPGSNNFANSSNNILTINGGTIYVNTVGDGLDANGSIYLNNGDIIVEGPTNDGNGTFDYDREFVITGGTVWGIGSSGMAQGASSSSSINSVAIYLTSNQTSGTLVTIKDSGGRVIAEHTATKTFSFIFFASNELTKGEAYKIYLNNDEYQSFTISTTITTVGNSRNGMNRRMR